MAGYRCRSEGLIRLSCKSAESHVRKDGIVELCVRFVRQRLSPFRGVGEVERPGNRRTTLILRQKSSEYNMSDNR